MSASADYIHPVSGLRLLRAQLPAEERRHPVQPIRIRDEPQDRDLEQEKKANAEHIAYHRRRCEQENAAFREKFQNRSERITRTFTAKTEELQRKYAILTHDILIGYRNEDLAAAAVKHGQKLERVATECRNKMERFSAAAYKRKIDEICTRRRELAWICPNDGMAHPFNWQGRKYYREYNGNIWSCDESGMVWRGKWTGYYISLSDAPKLAHQ